MGREIEVQDAGKIWVLPHVAFVVAKRIESHGNLVSLDAFLSEFGGRSGGTCADSEKAARQEEIGGSLFEQFPWLAKYMEDREKKDDEDSMSSTPMLDEAVASAARVCCLGGEEGRGRWDPRGVGCRLPCSNSGRSLDEEDENSGLRCRSRTRAWP